MSQAINSISTHGLFEAAQTNSYTLTSDSFSADLRDAKDSVLAVIDIPSPVTDKFELICLSVDGDEYKRVPLVSKTINLIHLTTLGIKRSNGFGEFKIVSPSGAIVPAAGIKLYFVKYSPVVNH